MEKGIRLNEVHYENVRFYKGTRLQMYYSSYEAEMVIYVTKPRRETVEVIVYKFIFKNEY